MQGGGEEWSLGTDLVLGNEESFRADENAVAKVPEPDRTWHFWECREGQQDLRCWVPGRLSSGEQRPQSFLFVVVSLVLSTMPGSGLVLKKYLLVK